MYSFPPLAAAIGVLYTVVTTLTTALNPLLGPVSTAVAIVVITAAVRLALLPLGYAQVRGERIRVALLPKIQQLQRRHRADPERLRRELAALYQREGASPLAGCLPALAQVPVFMVLYGLFLTADVGGEPNVLLTDTLAGVPLGSHLVDVTGGLDLAVFGVLLALLALVALATRRTMPALSPETPGGGMIRLVPFGTLLVAAIVPLAAGLYLLISTAWTVTERTLLRRRLMPGSRS
jgi:YidC/Oxa1 family membrane protein insertase